MAKPAAPGNGTVRIVGVEAVGDGCPRNSVVVALSDDGQALTVSYSQLSVEVGPSATPGAATTRQCQLHATVSVPAGWAYALASVDFRGFASLAPGVTATKRATYHISGESPEKTQAAQWAGPLDDDFFMRDLGADSPPYFSRCGKGKNLKITTRIDIDNRGNSAGSGVLVVDTTDAEVYHLVWQRCSDGK